MVAQVAVGLGVVVLLPLGDLLDSRRIVIGAIAGQIAALLLVAWSPNLATFLVGIALLGFLTIAPYLIPAAASKVTPPGSLGHVTGALTRGVIVGILFARSVGGVLGAQAGWRAAFLLAAACAALVLVSFARKVPGVRPVVLLPYRQLIASLPGLVRSEPTLRSAALTQALMFGSFSSLWIAVSLHIQSPTFGMSSSTVGALGLLGLISAAVAPRSGGMIDRIGAKRAVRLSIILTVAAWFELSLLGNSLAGIGAGIVMLDIGASAAHIAKQTTLYALEPGNRTRFVTVYVVSQYLGAGLLALLTGLAWAHGGWLGVCALGVVTTMIALAVNTVTIRMPPGQRLTAETHKENPP
jgi:predicted MFS family arabinose efflux permease